MILESPKLLDLCTDDWIPFSRQFLKEFSCKADSAMSAKKKCSVWWFSVFKTQLAKMGAKKTFMTVGAVFVHFPETMRSAKVENSCGFWNAMRWSLLSSIRQTVSAYCRPPNWWRWVHLWKGGWDVQGTHFQSPWSEAQNVIAVIWMSLLCHVLSSQVPQPTCSWKSKWVGEPDYVLSCQTFQPT